MEKVHAARVRVKPDRQKPSRLIVDVDATLRLYLDPSAPEGSQFQCHSIEVRATREPDPQAEFVPMNARERAIALISRDPDKWAAASMDQLAKAVGCHRTTLHRQGIGRALAALRDRPKE